MIGNTPIGRVLWSGPLLGPALVLAAVHQSAAGEWGAVDAGFANTPAEHRLLHYSAHDGSLMPVEQMAAAGIGGIQLFMQSDGYLQTGEAWQNVAANMAAAEAAGLRLWIADDNGYPSGQAGGKVVDADPAHEARCLIEVTLEGRGQNPFSLSLPAGAGKFVFAYLYPRVSGQPDLTQPQIIAVQDNLVTGTGRSGDWALRAFALQIDNEGNQATGTAAGFQYRAREQEKIQLSVVLRRIHALLRPVPQFELGHRRDRQLAHPEPGKPLPDRRLFRPDQENAHTSVQQPRDHSSSKRRSCNPGCARSAMKSSPNPSSAPNITSQSWFFGNNTTAAPSHVTTTSFPSKRNSFGNRTA